MRKIFKLFIVSLFLISCEGEENTTPEPISKFTLTTQANPEEGGTVFPSSGDYNDGDQVNVQATPSQYYEFINWGGNGNGSNSNPLNVTINSNINLIAEFSKKDSDNDGVTDDIDLCPNTLSEHTQHVSANGCYEPIYLDENGITIKAKAFAAVGDKFTISDKEYIVVDLDLLKQKIEADEDLEDVVTTFITDMNFLFLGNVGFNKDIGYWDVSNVTTMIQMFDGTIDFDQDISLWDVSNVTDMGFMFQKTNFNQDISTWDVSNVISIAGMFAFNVYFNQDISGWDVSKVIDMSYVFAKTKHHTIESFNQDISSWDVSNVTNMKVMFGTSKFDQDISSWDVSKVTNMSGMFEHSIFNQDLSGWDVSKVTDCAFFAHFNSSWTLPKPNFTGC